MTKSSRLPASWLFIPVTLAVFGVAYADEPRPSLVDRYESDTVVLKEGARKIKTQVYDIKELGVLLDSGSKPAYVLLSGRGCQMSDTITDRKKPCTQEEAARSETGIFLLSLATGRVHNFVYPGKIVDSKAGRTVLDARSFFGRCLKEPTGESYVAFQKEVVDRRKGMQSSVYVGTPGKDMLVEKLYEKKLPRIDDTLRRVKSRKCWEISGRNRHMSSQSIHSILKPVVTGSPLPEDDEDDVAPKENQTNEELPPQQE